MPPRLLTANLYSFDEIHPGTQASHNRRVRNTTDSFPADAWGGGFYLKTVEEKSVIWEH